MDVEDRLRSVHLLEIMNDLENRRLRAVKMQARIGTKCVTPRRAEESHNQMIGRVSVGGDQILIAPADELNRCVEVSDIPGGQIKNCGFDLKADPLRAG